MARTKHHAQDSIINNRLSIVVCVDLLKFIYECRIDNDNKYEHENTNKRSIRIHSIHINISAFGHCMLFIMSIFIQQTLIFPHRKPFYLN